MLPRLLQKLVLGLDMRTSQFIVQQTAAAAGTDYSTQRLISACCNVTWDAGNEYPRPRPELCLHDVAPLQGQAICPDKMQASSCACQAKLSTIKAYRAC